MAIEGSATADIRAPVGDVFEVAADYANAPRWQPELEAVEVIETDDEDRQTLVWVQKSLAVRRFESEIRFEYSYPHEICWSQETGPLKALAGGWVFERLDASTTRATCTMRLDLGRALSLAVRGPVADQLRHGLIESMPLKLKGYVERIQRSKQSAGRGSRRARAS